MDSTRKEMIGQHKIQRPEQENNDNSEAEEEMIQRMCNLWMVDNRVKSEGEGKKDDLSGLKWELCILGKFMIEKYINFSGLYNYLKMKWSPSKMA